MLIGYQTEQETQRGGKPEPQIVDALRQLVTGLSFDGPLFGDDVSIGKGLFSRELLGKQILQRSKS